jgi:hypothetical protein
MPTQAGRYQAPARLGINEDELTPLVNRHGNFIVSRAAMQSTARVHKVTVLLPTKGGEQMTFSCAEDEFILNAGWRRVWPFDPRAQTYMGRYAEGATRDTVLLVIGCHR